MQAINFGRLILINPKQFKEQEGSGAMSALSAELTKINTESLPVQGLERMGLNIILEHDPEAPQHLQASLQRSSSFGKSGEKMSQTLFLEEDKEELVSRQKLDFPAKTRALVRLVLSDLQRKFTPDPSLMETSLK